jgi:hypothetical protein
MWDKRQPQLVPLPAQGGSPPPPPPPTPTGRQPVFLFFDNPQPGDGQDGDVNVSNTTWDVWMKVSGAWVLQGNIKGAAGPSNGIPPGGLPGQSLRVGADGNPEWYTP